MKKLSLILLFFVVSMGLSSFVTINPKISVTVQINYGVNHALRDTTIKVDANITALEALQHVSSVETHPVGNFVFVTAIDGVKGIRGDMAWYYEVNHKSTKKLAINQVLNDGDIITWIYRKDVCSVKVDGCKNKQ